MKKTGSFKLQVPIEIEKDDTPFKLTELTIRRLKAKELKLISNPAEPSIDDVFAIMASVTDLSVDDIGELDIDDFNGLYGALESFLGKSQMVGAGKEASGQ